MECKLISSLTKVFADQAPQAERVTLSVLKGETASFQLAAQGFGSIRVKASAPGFRVQVREVGQVPVTRPCGPDVDDNYLRKMPGLFPDVLLPLPEDDTCRLVGGWKAFWIDAEPEAELPGGDYTVGVEAVLTEGSSAYIFRTEQPVHVTDRALPEQKLLHTEWFHCDCLADYYHVQAWSEEHWVILEHFIRSAVRMGINLILTPIFTPALDTQEGGERTTVQLVDVIREKCVYSFGFEKLNRWVKLCLECGITHFEMAHLYSQWGSNRAPKIMATDDGVYRRIFGWETEGTGREYAEFLAAFLPALTERLQQLEVADRCFFHIMDEPHHDHLECYLQQRAQAVPYLEGFRMMDALSEFAFYRTGAVEIPVVATNSPDLEKFLAADMPELWMYYCCGQDRDVSNRFIAMPAARTRILGVQLYHYQVNGFLQWGFNFYNSRLSLRKIDPYAVTDSDEAFPAGDPFIVYPGEDGTAVESIRYMLMRQSMHDLRALELLETLAGRETVEKLIMEGVREPLTLTSYPKENAYLIRLRQRVNREIEKYI